MFTSALRRAVTAWVVLSICALLLGSGIVGNTFASFNAETTNLGSTFSDGWLASPASGTATAGGYDMNLSWTASGASAAGVENVLGVDNGTSSNCTGAAYASIATGLATSTSSYSDANRATATTDGDWYCYELTNTLAGSSWSVAADTLPAVQIGLAASGLTIANSGTSGTVNKGDSLTITFNQQTTLASQATMTVCVFKKANGNVILLGDTSSCSSATSDTYTIGELTLSGATLSANQTYNKSSTTVAATAPWTVKVTLGSNSSPTSTVSGTPTWGFIPASTVKSSQTTHQATACTTTASTCQPTTSTNF